MDVAGTQRAERWELYRLLSEPSRLRMLALTAAEELAVSELADLLGESQPNVSRHAAPLRTAGLLAFRKHGTWTLLRLADGASRDPVVADALATGRALCLRDGTLARASELVRARDRSTREFFSRPQKPASSVATPPAELGAYLALLAPLLPRRALAVDAGTGEGRCLEVLAPVFDRVVAIDRSDAQLDAARERVRLRGFAHVELLQGELDDPAVRAAIGPRGADAVFAARVLHHAPRPAEFLASLASLAAPGGAVCVLEYAPHEDEALREQQADLWLGFEPDELCSFARAAGLEAPAVSALPPTYTGTGPDRHLPWQALVARKP